MVNQDTLKTIWEVPDDLWEEIEQLIAELDSPKHTGRKRADPRKMLNAIIFRMRSGCQWNQLPAHLGDDSTVHRTLQRWESIRLFPRMWELIQTRCEELKGVDWEWQSADTSMGKARLGGMRLAQTPQTAPSSGTKRSILVEASGRPLSVVVAGANVHDTKLLEATLESVVAERPAPTERSPQHLCLDKGYDNPTGHQTVARHGYQSHIRRIGEEKLDTRGNKRYPARRWVVERTLGGYLSVGAFWLGTRRSRRTIWRCCK